MLFKKVAISGDIINEVPASCGIARSSEWGV
jgi:hypothetical protein